GRRLPDPGVEARRCLLQSMKEGSAGLPRPRSLRTSGIKSLSPRLLHGSMRARPSNSTWLCARVGLGLSISAIVCMCAPLRRLFSRAGPRWSTGSKGRFVEAVRKARPVPFSLATSFREERIVHQVTDMLAFAHFAGQRLPFRRLQGVLAFAITGGLACNDILNGYLPSLADRFYSLLFQREARGRARPEPAARVLAGVDPEYAPDRNADTRIWSWLGGSDVNLPGFE